MINAAHAEAQVHKPERGIDEAERLQVKGEVKNMTDGSVYVRAEGPEHVLQNFIDYLNRGPGRLARVDDVSLTWYENLRNDQSFRITY